MECMVWTLTRFTEFETVVRNSVFLAKAMPVADERAALAFLEDVAVQDATHNCWAFRVGQRFRVSDDGEPSGTAGRPILSAIDGQNFDNVMVVVTRWFGGIKLGAGGLVRAYGAAAGACLRQAEKKEYIEKTTLSFHCPFSLYAQVEAKFIEWCADKLKCEFDAEGVQLIVAVPVVDVERITDFLRDLTRGQIDIQQE
ncbi:IMPACT family protein [Swingsia samuiensis]|uniref:YigZ family protein n=1 Tax=Swingsia samuiensis TaxID=1293412 RepID=A0A4Y6ULC6_9PROT|nr:YigZ family protein [Swingsia samuiensis]QDH16835.1 YigZ family protein [Swingsia samuiensis]